MKQSNIKYALIGLLMSASIVVSAVTPVFATQNAQQQIEKLRAEQKALASKISGAEADIDAIQKKQYNLSSEYAFLSERSAEHQKKVEETLLTVKGVYKIKQSLDFNLQKAIENFENKKVQYGQRIETMFQLQNKSVLELLFEAKSLDGFFTTVKFMKMISDEDELILKDLRQSRENLNTMQIETKKQIDQLESILAGLERELSALQSELYSTDQEYINLDSALSKKLEQIAEFSRQDTAMMQSISRYQAQLSSGAKEPPKTPIKSGRCGWPCPGYSSISSPFGYRSIPEIGLNDFHTGLDMAADYNTPVYAAAGGVVTVAGVIMYGGNTIRIATGGGLDMMYCHLNGFNVVAGQTVNAGDLIGFVGSTGLSSGPHLHFEIQINGTPVDPMPYLN